MTTADSTAHTPLVVTREPPGLPDIEHCRECGWPTQYWVNFGEYPLCGGCCAKRNAKAEGNT